MQKIWHILVADDDPTMGLLMRAALGDGSFELVVVDNGRAALDAFLAHPFDMVMLDVEMPEMDGLAVCAAIRQSEWPATPVMLVTGREDDDFVSQARALDAGLLAKPVNWGTLSASLRAVLG